MDQLNKYLDYPYQEWLLQQGVVGVAQACGASSQAQELVASS